MEVYEELNRLNQSGQEYREHCVHRWIMLLGGLFWGIAIPVAYYLAFDQIRSRGTAEIVFITLAMCALMFAAIVLLKNGIVGLIVNGRKHLTLHEDGLEIFVNDGKHKGEVYNIKYEDIRGFHFCARKVKKNRTTGALYIENDACGTINFYNGTHNINDFYCVDVYNAASAARFIIERLEDGQIDMSVNDIDRDGRYIPSRD